MSLIQLNNSQKGASLIEILVSLVVMAIGILGVAALQTNSLKSNQSAYVRTQATLLGFDVVERMRANQTGVLAGNYNNTAGQITANCNSQAGCSSVQLAANDIAEWKALVAQKLPLGSGTICIDSTANDGTALLPACDGTGTIYAVKTWWDGNRDGTATQRLVMSFQL